MVAASSSPPVAEDRHEPLEAILLRALEAARLPGMTVEDMIVCREVYECQMDEVPRHYVEVEYRLAKHQGYSHAEACNALWHAYEHGFIEYKLALWGGGKGNFASFPIADVVLSPQVYEILQAAERRVHEKDKAFVGTKEWMDWVTGVSVRR
jgi:hypothetical protein